VNVCACGDEIDRYCWLTAADAELCSLPVLVLTYAGETTLSALLSATRWVVCSPGQSVALALLSMPVPSTSHNGLLFYLRHSARAFIAHVAIVMLMLQLLRR